MSSTESDTPAVVWGPNPVRPSWAHYRKGAEFVRGRWLDKNPCARADRIGLRLLARLQDHLGDRGQVCGPLAGYQCFPDDPLRVLVPDGSYFAAGQDPTVPDDEPYYRVRPDLIADVVAPGDRADAVCEKVMSFLRVGVGLAWIVYPQTKTVWVSRPDGTVNWLGPADELNGETVLPGFRLSLADLFSEV